MRITLMVSCLFIFNRSHKPWRDSSRRALFKPLTYFIQELHNIYRVRQRICRVGPFFSESYTYLSYFQSQRAQIFSKCLWNIDPKCPTLSRPSHFYLDLSMCRVHGSQLEFLLQIFLSSFLKLKNTSKNFFALAHCISDIL